MPTNRILYDWDFPVVSKIKGFFQNFGFGGRGGGFGIMKKSLTWANVIDPNKTTGNPPALNSDTLLVTKHSQPFSLEIVKKLKFTVSAINNGQIAQQNVVVVDSAPYYFSVGASEIHHLEVFDYSHEYKLTELLEGETLMNRYIPRQSGIPG